MILRSVTKHIKEQNWFSVFLELFILVIGVFIGIQVANWNDEQAEYKRERLLLGELRNEVVESIRLLKAKRDAFMQVERSGTRAIDYLDFGADCGNDCWPVIVDFFHASQWQQLVDNHATFDEMRRYGWPRNRQIIKSVEAYLRQSNELAGALKQEPVYRNLVRGLIPLAIHKSYWPNCYKLINGEEVYLEDCPMGVPPDVSAAAIKNIKSNPLIHSSLTQWTGFSNVLVASMNSYIDSAESVLPLIDKELEQN
jgi:hypothetical protein